MDIKYEGGSYNQEWISSFTDFSTFSLEVSSTWFEGDANRDNKLKELYDLCNPKKKKADTKVSE